MKLHRLVFAALLVGTAILTPAKAEDSSTRIDLLEEQIRLLTGKVEELNFTVKQLQGQVRKGGQAQAIAPKPAVEKKRPTIIGGTEEIQSEPIQAEKKVASLSDEPDSIYGADPAAPAAQDMTKGKNAAAQSEDGGFQGQVLVPDDQQAAVAQPAVTADEDANADGGVEQVSLQQDTPESLYKRSDEALLRRQFPEAEQGFRDFLSKYPEHSLAGSAQYWLGETFYVQGDYRTAAQNFLSGYQKFPKSRRAPDSLLKLGLALNKLGQKSQACAALGNVSSEFPKAVEAKKRAQTEFRRAGC